MKNKTYKIQFANQSEDQVELIEFENEMSLQADGWAQLAKYGDFPGKGFRKRLNGTLEQFPAIQRMTREAAQDMEQKFKSPLSRIKRYVTGCPIYNGHPNTPMGAGSADKGVKGTIVDLQAREEGLYCKPVFYNEAEELLNQPNKIFFSGHWTSDELPAENGKRIFRPDKLKSAGLTPWPNLPVEHVNEREKLLSPDPIMNKTQILILLAAHGIQFANEATDEQVLEALRGLGATAKTADSLAQEKIQWANEKTKLEQTVTARDATITTVTAERDTLKTNFANERAQRIKGLLDTAVTGGKIAQADRPEWERRLNDLVQFANEAEALTKLAPTLKTTSKTMQMGERKVEIANAADRRQTLTDLINAEMQKNGGNYDSAYAQVKRSNPALFEAMKSPELAK